jgi:hypothetical protein
MQIFHPEWGELWLVTEKELDREAADMGSHRFRLPPQYIEAA